MRKILPLCTLASAIVLLWPALASAAPVAGSSVDVPADPASARAPMPTVVDCYPDDPIVFVDAFGCEVTYQAFAGSKLDALSVDGTVWHQGTASIKVVVPAPGDPSGGYAGGAFVTPEPRWLLAYDALSFWVKASRNVTLDVAGFGNDNTGTSRFTAQRSGIPVTTSWQRVLVPIPYPDAVLNDRGRFFFADGPDAGAGYTLWFDDVSFEGVPEPTIANPRPVLATQTLNAWVGARLSLQGKTWTIYEIEGIDRTVTHMPGYFGFPSSDPSVALVFDDSIRALGQGTAVITGALGWMPATGSITVNVTAPPATAAATPTLPADHVISLFSDAYPNVPVDTWSAPWDQANVADYPIGADHTKVYTSLGYAGIEFVSHTIDASAMSRFHMDVWVPAGSPLKVKLVDFGADGVFGGDDSESELTFHAGSTTPLVNGGWVGLDVPLSDFTGLASRAHLAQLILSGGTPTVFVDNIYFHDALLGVDERGPAGFALRGVTPNPARDDLRVRFSLRDPGPVTLAVLDVSGRELTARRVEGLGPGLHTVPLGSGSRLPVGVYLIRLTQNKRSLVTRAAIIR